MLIRLGATPITKSEDVIRALGLELKPENSKSHDISYDSLSMDERKIVEKLREPMSRDELIRSIGMPASDINMILTAMEIKGIVTENMGEIHLC